MLACLAAFFVIAPVSLLWKGVFMTMIYTISKSPFNIYEPKSKFTAVEFNRSLADHRASARLQLAGDDSSALRHLEFPVKEDDAAPSHIAANRCSPGNNSYSRNSSIRYSTDQR